MAIVAQTFNIDPGYDGVKRSIDPYASFNNGTAYTSAVLPVVTRTSNADQKIAAGNIYTAVFTSTARGHWEIAAGFDGIVKSVSSDGLTCTVTWSTPANMPGESFHVAAKCINQGGTGWAFDRVHVGSDLNFAILKVGVGHPYADLSAAFLAMDNGDRIVVKDGTYTGDNNVIRPTDGNVTQNYQPKSGNYTTDNTGVDPVHTVQNYSCVMSETPFGATLDAELNHSSNINLRGNTLVESDGVAEFGSDVNNYWITISTVDHIGIKFAGFIGKGANGTSMWCYHCAFIKFQYCLPASDRKVPSTTAENFATISISRSTDCLVEYCGADGAGRYMLMGYISKRCVFRRAIMRSNIRLGDDPMGGAGAYSCREFRFQNILHIDSATGDFWKDCPMQGSYSIPATGAQDFPRDVYYDRVGSLNNDMGMFSNDAYDVDNTNTTMQLNDFWGHNVKTTQSSLMRGGPTVYTRGTLTKVDLLDTVPATNSSRGMNSWGGRMTLYNVIFSECSYDRDSDTNPGLCGPLGVDPGNEGLFVNDGYVHDFNYSPVWSPGFDPVVDVNVDYTNDPYTRGLMYPGRVEIDSILETDGDGANNFYRAKGIAGAHYGDTGDNDNTTTEWLPNLCHELIAPYIATWDYTGDPRGEGEITLLGNRGWVQAGEHLEEYIKSAYGNTPFPSVSVYKSGSGIGVSIRRFAANYMTNITGFKIYIAGSLAQTIGVNDHEIIFGDLVPTHTYSVEVVAVDSVTGDSGASLKVEVTI